ncbi:hypothetical protein, partial [Pseudoalteromonas luteoviolacea]|uniref:hypothetical protein n=2 Tax=Pseudoalteromonas luteoviolacea TaxID=43657 RepID=UPI000B17B064
MSEESIKHVQWIFSGAGILVITWFIAWVKKTKLTTIKDKVSKAHGFLISIFCSKSVTIQKVKIDIRPRHNPFELWLNEDLPKSKFWLMGVNFNSFDITIKQVIIEFNYGAMNATCNTFLQGRDIGKHSINEVILVEDNLTGEQADYIAGFNDEPNCIVRIKAILKTPTKEVIYQGKSMK